MGSRGALRGEQTVPRDSLGEPGPHSKAAATSGLKAVIIADSQPPRQARRVRAPRGPVGMSHFEKHCFKSHSVAQDLKAGLGLAIELCSLQTGLTQRGGLSWTDCGCLPADRVALAVILGSAGKCQG